MSKTNAEHYYKNNSKTLRYDEELFQSGVNQLERQYNAIKEQRFNELVEENKQLKDNWNKLNKKYENVVADYEQTMFEKEQLKKQLEEYKDNYNCLLKQKDAIDKAIEYNKKNNHSQTLYKILKEEK